METAGFSPYIHGSALIGTFLSLCLFGINTGQIFEYFITFYSRDPWYLQLLVGALGTLGTFTTICNTVWVYGKIVMGFEHSEHLTNVPWSYKAFPLLMGLTISPVQVFYAWRIYILTRNKWVSAFVFLSGITTGVTSVISFIVLILSWHNFLSSRLELVVMGIAWYIIAAVCDIVITVSLSWHLYRWRFKSIPETDTLLNKVIRVTIQNGMMVTIGALVDLILFLVAPGRQHYVLLFTLPKLYINAVMSSLNARTNLNFDITGDRTRQPRTDLENSRPIATGGIMFTPIISTQAEGLAVNVNVDNSSTCTAGKETRWDSALDLPESDIKRAH